MGSRANGWHKSRRAQSVEFYELLRSRLDGDGLVAQWLATPRTFNSVTAVFPS